MASLALHRSHVFNSPAGKLPYLLYEPPGWSEEVRPLVLFLHGAGERGGDIERVTSEGLPREIERGRNLPFVAVSPHCPHGKAWVDMSKTLTLMLDELVPKLHIDERRIYLTGLSMGAFGAWKLAAATPERFAALVPVCGGGNPSWAQRLRQLPTWAFHGAEDDVVSVHHTESMVDALRQVGAPIRSTIYPGVKHDAWTQTYENPEVIDWMLGQRRGMPQANDRTVVGGNEPAVGQGTEARWH
jgi:predicted peptidase